LLKNVGATYARPAVALSGEIKRVERGDACASFGVKAYQQVR
jgi:hypothetical protein